MSSLRRAEAVSEAWLQMQQLVDADRRAGRVGTTLGLGPGRGRVGTLLLLAVRGPLGLSEIATAQGFDRPYATVVVDQLEGLGMVERSPHPDDRRRKIVRLSPAGEAAAASAREKVAEPPPAFDALSREEAVALAALLGRLTGPAPDRPAGDRARRAL